MRLDEIFSLYAYELRRFLKRRLKNFADVEDCAQETFLKVWLKGTQGGLREDIRAYLFTTALNVVRDKRRRDIVRKKDLHTELSGETGSLRTTELETELHWKEALGLIERELKNLRPSTRKVFLMHFADHQTYDQIAARLGISTRTVEREIARALEHMKIMLQDIFGPQED